METYGFRIRKILTWSIEVFLDVEEISEFNEPDTSQRKLQVIPITL